jgi:hypothetical protein
MSSKKFQAPKGFTRQSSSAVGFWTDDGESAVLFVPTGVKIMDGSKKADESKPSIMLIGTLKQPAPLQNKDETFDGAIGDIVGVFWKAGMGREIVNAYGIETWIAPLFDESGERKTMDVGKGQPMKLYDVQFGKKLSDAGKRIPVLEDTRVKSKNKKTPFDDPRLAPVRAQKDDADDGVDEDNIPF